MSTAKAPECFRKLNGIFPVYKPANMAMKALLGIVKVKLLNGR